MKPQPKQRLSRRLQRAEQKELVRSSTRTDLNLGTLDLLQDYTNMFHASREA